MSNSCRTIGKIISILGILGTIYLSFITLSIGFVVTIIAILLGVLSTFISYVFFTALGEVLDYLENIQNYLKPNNKEPNIPITKLNNV